MRIMGKKSVSAEIDVICDRCGRRGSDDDGMEAQEFLRHHDVGGFGSVFGDGTPVDLDLCQHCVREVLEWVKQYEHP